MGENEIHQLRWSQNTESQPACKVHSSSPDLLEIDDSPAVAVAYVMYENDVIIDNLASYLVLRGSL